MLVDSTVYCFEPLRHVFDAVELGGFLKCKQVAEPLGALNALFEEGSITIDGCGSDASLCLVVVRADKSRAFVRCSSDYCHLKSHTLGQLAQGQY